MEIYILDSGAALRGIQGIHWIPIFVQKFPYIFQPSKISILVTNLCAGDAEGSGYQVGQMKRPFYDSRNDAHATFTILFFSKKVDNWSLIHWGIFSKKNVDIWAYYGPVGHEVFSGHPE